jgi:hypothetical protein
MRRSEFGAGCRRLCHRQLAHRPPDHSTFERPMTNTVGSQARKWFTDLLTPSLIVSLLALGVSAKSCADSRNVEHDASTKEAIEKAYDAWLGVSQAQMSNWQLAHLFALREQYPSAVREVALYCSKMRPDERAGMRMRERAFAEYLFTVFEENLYLWRHARDVGDSRESFYKEVLDYETSRELRNPRLRYWWDAGGVSQHFEIATRQYYQLHVVGEDLGSPPTAVDSIGPYGERPSVKKD